jgi:hypothetical protein
VLANVIFYLTPSPLCDKRYLWIARLFHRDVLLKKYLTGSLLFPPNNEKVLQARAELCQAHFMLRLAGQFVSSYEIRIYRKPTKCMFKVWLIFDANLLRCKLISAYLMWTLGFTIADATMPHKNERYLLHFFLDWKNWIGRKTPSQIW